MAVGYQGGGVGVEGCGGGGGCRWRGEEGWEAGGISKSKLVECSEEAESIVLREEIAGGIRSVRDECEYLGDQALLYACVLNLLSVPRAVQEELKSYTSCV